MRVILAKTAGFCYGVERAVALAHETAKAHGGAMLGSVIHNANVVAELEREGMRLIASPEEAAAGETVLGYANFLHVLDEGDIGNVAVAPEHRRQGIADALLDALCARAAALNLAFLTLEVRASNAPAIALYRKHGFQTVGQRRNYYQKPDEDALLMTWFRREAETI